MKKYKVVSLFAGIGGIDIAFIQNGYDIVWANEIDKFAAITYRKNFPNHNLIEGDIKKIKVEDIPEHDILVGGFPCQTFSIAQGNKENRGLNDPRGHLFKEILRVLEYHKPKWFLLENVKGLLNKSNKEAFTQIIEGLEQLGYKVDYKVLNAKYYGVPQNRERIYIIGNLAQKDFKWPEPTNRATKIKDILEQEVDAKYYLSKEAWEGMLKRKWKTSGNDSTTFYLASKEEREALATNNNRIFSTFKENDSHTSTIRARYYKDGSECLIFQDRRDHNRASEKANKENISPTLTGMTGDIPYIFQNRRGIIRENKENISPTLTANMGTGGNNQPFIYRPQKIGTIGNDRQGYRVYDPENVGVSIKSESGGVFKHTEGYLINNRPRRLTPRECARLQGFSDDFKIIVSDTQAYKQFGNSVAIPVLKKIVEKIKELWK